MHFLEPCSQHTATYLCGAGTPGTEILQQTEPENEITPPVMKGL